MADDGVRTAVVAGAGIGGLAAAVGLCRTGVDVTVLEQEPEIAEVGAGISLWPNALRALDALGVGAEVRAAGVRAVSRGGMRLPSGAWVRRERADDIPVLVLHRADLHRALLDALPPGVVRTGAQVTGVDPGTGTVTYRTDGPGADVRGDLVVAADGVRSALRTAAFPGAPAPVFDGRTVWRAVTAYDEPFDAAITLERTRQFGLLPLPGGRAYWFLTADAAHAGIRYDDDLAEVRRLVGEWHAPLPAVLDATPGDAVLHNDVTVLPPLDTYARGRVVLLGDAAHAQSPDLGQGACQAIEDAVVLAAGCAAAPDGPAAAAAYDAARRPRSQAVAAAARQQARLTHEHPRAMTTLARVLPPALWRRRIAQWTDWTPPAL